MALNDQAKKNKKNTGGGLYIALAVCILSVVCVGVYGAVLGLVKPMTGTTDPRGEELPRVTAQEPNGGTPASSNRGDHQDDMPPKKTAPTENPVEEPDQSVSVTPVAPEFVLPLVGSVIKEYSDDLLVYSETMNDYRVHNGIDLASVIGERVKVMTDGVVESVYDDPLMGETVVIDHGNGLKSVYQGLMPSVPDGIEAGAAVKAGDVIGGVGDTALVECAEEPHLHFEVWQDGVPVDPRTFFN